MPKFQTWMDIVRKVENANKVRGRGFHGMNSTALLQAASSRESAEIACFWSVRGTMALDYYSFRESPGRGLAAFPDGHQIRGWFYNQTVPEYRISSAPFMLRHVS